MKYTRPSRITFTNPLNAIPQFQIDEEEVSRVDNKDIVDSMHNTYKISIREDMKEKEFPLYNSETGEIIEGASINYQELQTILHSLYLHVVELHNAE